MLIIIFSSESLVRDLQRSRYFKTNKGLLVKMRKNLPARYVVVVYKKSFGKDLPEIMCHRLVAIDVGNAIYVSCGPKWHFCSS